MFFATDYRTNKNKKAKISTQASENAHSVFPTTK